VKFKKLAGGGYFKIINRAVPEAFARAWATARPDIAEIEAYAVGHARSAGAGHQPHHLKAKGFNTAEAIEKVEKALPTAFDIKFAFNKWTLARLPAQPARRVARDRRVASSTCWRTWAFPSARSKRQHPRCGG